MKKVMTGAFVLAIITFVIDWGVLGLKIFDGDYNIATEAYIGAACWVVMLITLLYRKFNIDKCLYCGKLRMTNGKYCTDREKMIQECKNPIVEDNF